MYNNEKCADLTATGNNIRRLMKENVYTVKKLTEETGIAQSTIYNHLNGCNLPSHYCLSVYTKVFNAKLDEIIVYK